MAKILTEQERKWVNEACCLDSAFERVAIIEGLVDPKNPAFDENIGGFYAFQSTDLRPNSG